MLYEEAKLEIYLLNEEDVVKTSLTEGSEVPEVDPNLNPWL